MRYFIFASPTTAKEFMSQNYGALPVEGHLDMLKAFKPDVIDMLRRFATEVDAPTPTQK